MPGQSIQKRSLEEMNATRSQNDNKTQTQTRSPKRRRMDTDEPIRQLSSPQRLRNSQLFLDDDDDDENIPYTHSRSVSPLLPDSSDIEEVRPIQAVTAHVAPTTPDPINNTIITIDDDDDGDATQYYVISDGEGDDDDDNDDDLIEIGSTKSPQKTVNQLLEENKERTTTSLSGAHCCVCFDPPDQTIVLPCGHVYCKDCVFKALSSMKKSTKSSGPCALCRVTTQYKKVIVGRFKKQRKTLEGC